MFAVVSMKAVRLLLSVGVSIWMAGGCLFGCTGTAMGAESEQEVQTAVASESCHARHSATQSTQPAGVPSFAPAPRGMMKECPLVMNATAVASKNTGHVPEPGRVPVSALPIVESRIEQSNIFHVVAYLPNRGPTHLRCCVFLI